MRVIFLAEKPCALTVNGAFLGTVDGFERCAEVDPSDGVFCEFLPVGYAPVRFRLDEEFLADPPEQVRLYFIRRGVAIHCHSFVKSDVSLTVLWQERVGGSLLTLCMQGKLQLKIENETGLHVLSLPEEMIDCRPYVCGEELLLEGSEGFVLLGRDGSLRVRTEGKVLERGRTLRAEVPFRDSLAHTAVMEWRDGVLIGCTIRSKKEPTEATFALALFESVLIGADPAPYLSDTLKGKAGSLREFLGRYTSVVLTEDPSLVGLVFERRPRIYDVRYFRVTVTDGKISNIKEE